MGNLSNLYISQSFISLIHLGSDNTASVTPSELQDGLGNGVGVSVSTNKNLYVSGNVYAANLTGSVIDSSSFVTTASFNSYTSSQDFKNTTFATTSSVTASINTLSSSIYLTDATQSLNITINSQSAWGAFQSASAYSASSYQVDVSQSQQISASFATSSAYSASLAASITGSSANVTALSSSIYQTDATQSINISNNSSSIGLLQTFSGSQYKADSSSFNSRLLAGGQSQVQDEGVILGNVSSFNFNGAGVSASVSAGTASITIAGGGASVGGATTGSNTFTGDQTILGSIVSNPTSSLIELFSQAFVSGAVQYNITASNATSQSNLVLGGTPLASTNTGSVIISGSGNILFNPSKNLTGANAFNNGYVGGNNNYLAVIPQLHTQSLFNPAMNSNIGLQAVTMNFITSSLGVPTFSGNIFSSGITLNHQSGSISMQGNISNGGVTSTQNGLVSGTVQALINSNIIGNTLTLNHNSSSITTTNNAIFGQTTINNNYFHTGSNNNISFGNNLTNGTAIVINAGGSPSTNVFRPIVSNLIGGQTITIQADVTGSDLGGLRNEVVYGYNLIVSGAQSTAGTTQQGGAFFGRYNDINAGLADSAKTIFAVGTGNSTAARKTAFSIDSASVVNVSGSLSVTGSLIVTGSGFAIDSSGVVSASKYLIDTAAGDGLIFRGASTGSVNQTFNTVYKRDQILLYQYQGQPYAFNLNLSSGQYSGISGSQFTFGLQTNNSSSTTFGGSTYFAIISGSLSQSVVGGTEIPGGDVLVNSSGGLEITSTRSNSSFSRKVYIGQGLYVSSSAGSSGPTLTLNNSLNNTALSSTGSIFITGSVTINGNKQFNVGAFSSLISQSGSANVSQSMNFETTDISSGVSIASNSRITIANSGTYNIQFSAQVDRASGSGTDVIYIWLKKNGTNVSNTAGAVTVTGGAASAKVLASWNYVIDAAANDYYELCWQSADANIVLTAIAASGNIPLVPSVILTVTQVR
jgi:hypothetical protein